MASRKRLFALEALREDKASATTLEAAGLSTGCPRSQGTALLLAPIESRSIGATIPAPYGGPRPHT
jgi:hypothetical protein